MSVTIHGREYVTVAERVTAAHATSLMSITTELLVEDGKRYIVRATVTLKDNQVFTGHAEETRGSKGIAGQSPLEVAETSAVGRALGFAGFGSTESIASAEEVIRQESQATKPESARKAGKSPSASPVAPQGDPGAAKADASGITTPGEAWMRVYKDFGLNKSQAIARAKLTDDDLATLHPADLYIKVWMAIQGETLAGPQNDSGLANPNTERQAIVGIAKERAQNWTGPASTDDMQKLIIVLGELVSKDSDDQKLLLSWLFGYPSQGFSRKNLKGAEVQAIWTYMRLTLDNDNRWVPTSDATAPALAALLRQARLDAGQTELPL